MRGLGAIWVPQEQNMGKTIRVLSRPGGNVISKDE
jgi:hypothetical protein